MNILYIDHYAGSPSYGMEFRPYYFSKIWQEQGHSVRILAASFSHLRAKQPLENSMSSCLKKEENIEGIDYHWYLTPSYDGNGFRRAKNIFAFLWQVWRDRKNIAKEFNPDVVIASSTYPMDIWVAKAIAELSNAKLVFELHDLWPLSPIELGGMSSKHPFIMLCQIAENTVYKSVDAVVSMLPNVQGYLTDKFNFDLDKLTIIPNGIVVDDWKEQNKQPISNYKLVEFIQQEKKEGKVVVAYTGAHGLPNALDTLLDSAKLLKENNISFVLVGSGLEKVRLQERVANEHITNVNFFEPISKFQIPTFLDMIDIAYIGLQNQSLFRFGVSPNKMMDYMMAAKPILCAIRAGNDPVTEYQCGYTVDSDNPQMIANAILKMKALPTEELHNMGLRGKYFVLKNHSYTVLADEFLKAMDGLSAR